MTASLDTILQKAIQEQPLYPGEVMNLLRLKEEAEQEKLYEVARKLRTRYFGNRIFLYGFIYFSTWCGNNCAFCYYRRSNKLCARYRKEDAQVLEASVHLAKSGVHLLDLTMGEDPFYFDKKKGFTPLVRLAKKVKGETGLPIMISWGVLPDEVLSELAESGADWFACYQETHDPALFQKLRIRQDYDRRLQVKRKATLAGMLIEEGILSGVGESLGDIADSILKMKQMNPHQARVMNFVPQMGTPMEAYPFPHWSKEQIIIAVLRLLLPHRLIPASLDVGGIDGLKGKLQAGANVVTSLIPPSLGLRGVAQSDLGNSEAHRTVEAITPILDELGLRKARLVDYILWMKEEKVRLPKHFSSVGDFSIEGGDCWRKATRS
jgi:methylornithine synthase